MGVPISGASGGAATRRRWGPGEETTGRRVAHWCPSRGAVPPPHPPLQALRYWGARTNVGHGVDLLLGHLLALEIRECGAGVGRCSGWTAHMWTSRGQEAGPEFHKPHASRVPLNFRAPACPGRIWTKSCADRTAGLSGQTQHWWPGLGRPRGPGLQPPVAMVVSWRCFRAQCRLLCLVCQGSGWALPLCCQDTVVVPAGSWLTWQVCGTALLLPGLRPSLPRCCLFLVGHEAVHREQLPPSLPAAPRSSPTGCSPSARGCPAAVPCSELDLTVLQPAAGCPGPGL